MLRIPLPEYDGFALACLQLTANAQHSPGNCKGAKRPNGPLATARLRRATSLVCRGRRAF